MNNIMRNYLPRYSKQEYKINIYLIKHNIALRMVSKKFNITRNEFTILVSGKHYQSTHASSFQPANIKNMINGLYWCSIYLSLNKLLEKGFVRCSVNEKKKFYRITSKGQLCIEFYHECLLRRVR